MTDFGNLYVVAAPSGAGKTTLVKALVDSRSDITVSVSHTTRPKRPNEIHAINYYFIDKAQFDNMINANAFLEYALIFNHFYGTSKQWVEQTLATGMDVILEIDWQGYQQIKRLFPQVIGIFILPPSIEDLRHRLTLRNQDHSDIIAKRLADAQQTVSHLPEFDYVIINDDFNHALQDLQALVHAGRLLTRRQQAKYASLISSLG